MHGIPAPETQESLQHRTQLLMELANLSNVKDCPTPARSGTPRLDSFGTYPGDRLGSRAPVRRPDLIGVNRPVPDAHDPHLLGTKRSFKFGCRLRSSYRSTDVRAVAIPVSRVILYVKDVAGVAVFCQQHFGMKPLPGNEEGWVEMSSGKRGCYIALHKAASARKVARQ
jgi:hypothetical protein